MTFAHRAHWLKRLALAPFGRTRLPLYSPSSTADSTGAVGGEGGSRSGAGEGKADPEGEAIPPTRSLGSLPSPLAGEGENKALLTFDDGPHAEHTSAVLDRLAAYGVQAAFFLVGNRITDPALVERIAAAGHLLGNHTFAHCTPRWRDFSSSDVQKCQELLPGAKLFRSPLGRLTPGLWIAARRLGLECVGWSLDSGDWRCQSEADAIQCSKEVLELIRPGDIVLFHDDHPWIVPILDVVLPALANRHFFPSTPSTTQQPRKCGPAPRQ